eukprot:scpid8935/ scgid28036/ Fibroblast growth factor receptor 4
MLKWVKNRRKSSPDDGAGQRARRLNALYDAHEQTKSAEGRYELGLKRSDTAWDISMGSGQSPASDYHDGSLDEAMEHVASVSVCSSDQSTENSGELLDSWLEFPSDNLVIGQILHEGNFTCIMKAEGEGINGVDDSQVVCVKMLKDGVHRRYTKLLRCELELVKDIGPHPNIVSIVGSCMLRSPPCLVMEYLPNGSLLRYMRTSRGAIPNLDDDVPPLTGGQLLTFATLIAKGMAYLESTDTVHRDVAARNVFLTLDLIPKIGNFNSCVEGRLALKYNRGEEPKFLLNRKKQVTEKWNSLETLTTHNHTSASDVWSFGVLLWEIITMGGAPYSGIRPDNMLLYLKAGKRMEQPHHCSEQLFGLVLGCWEAMPAWRPRFSQLVDGLQLLAMQPEVSTINTVTVQHSTLRS